MSFTGYKAIIEEGDTVILYINPYKMFAIDAKPTILNKHNEPTDNVFQTMYGSLKVQSLIGKKYGSKVSLSKGWAYVLHPTSELWTTLLPHRTQIIYTPDISMVLFQLELKPGSVVIESGTGSGSVTHALARTVHPTGHVYTFEFHATRYQKAVSEFQQHGLSDLVTVSLRNVCQDGFGDDVKNKADAVFLDLPSPWEAAVHATPCLKKKGGRLGSFSPCIEQVQKTSEVLRSLGYVQITTLECFQKELTVLDRTTPTLSFNWKEEPKPEKIQLCTPAADQIPGHTGFLTFATLPPFQFRSATAVIQQPVKISDDVENAMDDEPAEVKGSDIANIILDDEFESEDVSMRSVSIDVTQS